MSTFAAHLLHFLSSFPLPPVPLPDSVQAEHPVQQPAVYALLQQFADKFYADNQSRVALLGINPGRFGAGRTGVAFTDPTALTQFCGIAHDLPVARQELSSQFVYAFITALGGPAEFYCHFYIGSIYPLVLLREGKNYNYYDSPALTKTLWPAMQRSLRQQVEELPLRRDVAVCLGQRNAKFLHRLNDELKLFAKIVVLDHPRYLMQYRRRNLEANVAHYVKTLGEFLLPN